MTDAMPHADVRGDVIAIQTHWNDKELIKSIPGSRWDNTEKIWTLPLTWAACVQLRGIFESHLTVGEGLAAWAWIEYHERVERSTQLRELTESSFGNLDLYPFQRAGVDWMLHAGSGLLGDEMGTGKTIQILTLLNELGTDDALPALVVCPNSVKMNWAKEAMRWLPKSVPLVLMGSAKNKADLLKVAQSESKALVVVNYENAWRLSRLAGFGSMRLLRCRLCDKTNGIPDLSAAKCEVHPRALNSIPFKTIIVDEAHRIKDPKAKQTRAVWALGAGESVTRRWTLTGTPLANDPSDLWSLMHFVAPKEYPTKSKFVDRYALQAWNAYGGLDVVGLNPQTKSEFYKIFDPRFRRMPKELVLQQLPPKIRTVRWIEMTPKQKKAYDELEKSLVTRLDNGQVMVARSNLSAQIRLLQLSSSYCRVDLGDQPEDPASWTVELAEPSPKLDELISVLVELGDKQVVVCAEQRRLIELASDRLTKLGVSHGLITGKITELDRAENLRRFQDGELRVLMFTMKAGGVGLTMTAADTMVRLQRSWSMVDNLQGEDRIHRIGSERHDSIHIIDLVTEGTVEVAQCLRLNEKHERLEEITRDRVRLAAAGQPFSHLDEEEKKIVNSFLGTPV